MFETKLDVTNTGYSVQNELVNYKGRAIAGLIEYPTCIESMWQYSISL
jgi:hypothetical protein